MLTANGYYGIEPFTRHNNFFFNLSLFGGYECLLSKSTGNSDSQRLQKYQYSGSWGKKVVLYLLAKVHKGHSGYVLILLEMDW